MPDTVPQANAADIVKAYLDAMERRDIAGANSFLAPGFAMTFPGGRRFTALQEVVDWARPRYRWVKKRYERFDAAPFEGGTAVYCFGALYGEWPDGAAFDHIRFIDRFTVRDGLLADQMVWNDLGEAASARRG